MGIQSCLIRLWGLGVPKAQIRQQPHTDICILKSHHTTSEYATMKVLLSIIFKPCVNRQVSQPKIIKITPFLGCNLCILHFARRRGCQCSNNYAIKCRSYAAMCILPEYVSSFRNVGISLPSYYSQKLHKINQNHANFQNENIISKRYSVALQPEISSNTFQLWH